jgi:hypothetical protein
MKNLHLIPTDKPSRLYEDVDCDLRLGYDFIHRQGMLQNQHIYITSDEEIKEGDWCYAILSKQVFKNANPNLKSEDKKKIILTTDQDLIEDGVQAIDDEFLEWFVENTSCEKVDLDTFSMGDRVLYNVVFPQEEPKQETLEPIVYNIGDNIRIINPTENQPKLFTTHKVDNNFGVVYYYQLDGKEESIGFSYIKKEEPKQFKKNGGVKMTISQQLNITTFPFEIKDNEGRKIYREESDGCWVKFEYNQNGNLIYYEHSNGDWTKWEHDRDGNRVYFEHSDGTIIDNRPNPEITILDIEPNTLIFHSGNETEPTIKLCQNGDIFIKGKLVENDLEVVEGMREFLKKSNSNGGDK